MTAAVLGAMAVSAVGLNSATAATAANDGLHLQHNASSRCLEETATGGTVLRKCVVEELAQEWLSEAVEGDAGDIGTLYRIHNLGSGDCLDVDDGDVVTAPCSSSRTQLWSTPPLVTNGQSDLCITAPTDDEIRMETCGGAEYEHQTMHWLYF